MTKFWYVLGDLIESSFGFIEKLGSGGWGFGIFNVFLMITGFVAFILWLRQLMKFEKEEIKFH
jgi:hypothetical protein